MLVPKLFQSVFLELLVPWAPADRHCGLYHLLVKTSAGRASEKGSQGLFCQAKGRAGLCDCVMIGFKFSWLCDDWVSLKRWFLHCPWQKLAQRDLQSMTELMEICCLWHHINDRLTRTFGAEKMKDFIQMFNSGRLAWRVFFGSKNQSLYFIFGVAIISCHVITSIDR